MQTGVEDEMLRSRDRWPAWVYAEGAEPDYRFSFANERTFLAWIRTALALIAGGVVLDAVALSVPDAAQRVLSVTMVLLGGVCAAASWLRWAASERAIRRGGPLPGSRLSLAVGVAVTTSAFALAAVLL